MKKLHKVVISLLFTLSILVANINIDYNVFASSQGHGESGGGAVESGTGYWREIRGKKNTSQAWNKFLDEKNTYEHIDFAKWVDNNLGNPELSTICKKSDVIWYYRADGRFASIGRNTNKAPWESDSRSTVEAQRYWKSYIQQFGNTWSRGEVVLICSGQFATMEDPVRETEWRNKHWRDAGESEEKVIGYWETKLTITPRSPEKGFQSSADRAEWNKGTSQQHVTSNNNGGTDFRKFVEANDPTKIKSKAEWDAWAAKANKVAMNAPNLEFELNEGNYNSFMNGRIFDIAETRQKRIVSAPFSYEEEYHEEYYRLVDKNTGEVIQDWKPTGKVKKTGNRRAKIGKVKNHNYGDFGLHHAYQIMNVRCNGDNFKDVLKATGAKDKSIAKGYGSGTLETKKYKSLGELPLGNANHPNKVLRQTGELSFFTETDGCEQSFACTNTPLGKSAKNDSNNNMFDGNNEIGSQAYVNKNEKKLLKEIEVFRSNNQEDGKFRFNVSYPKLKNSEYIDLYVDPNNAAKRTMFFIKDGGTPELGDIAKFAYGSSDGDAIKKSGKTTVNKHINELNAVSSWASDEDNEKKEDGTTKGKGHEISAAWEYAGKLYTNVPNRITSEQAKEWQKESAQIDLVCPFEAKEGTSGNPVANIPGIDGIRPNGVKTPSERIEEKVKDYVKVTFVRAVSSGN